MHRHLHFAVARLKMGLSHAQITFATKTRARYSRTLQNNSISNLLRQLAACSTCHVLSDPFWRQVCEDGLFRAPLYVKSQGLLICIPIHGGISCVNNHEFRRSHVEHMSNSTLDWRLNRISREISIFHLEVK